MRRVKITKTEFKCEYCGKCFVNKSTAKKCESEHKNDETLNSIFKEAESLEHLEKLIKKLVGNITVEFYNLRIDHPDTPDRVSGFVRFTSTDVFKRAGWFLSRVLSSSGAFGPLYLASGGGGDKVRTYDCLLFLKKFPKIYPKYVKVLNLISDYKETSLISLTRSRELDKLVSSSLSENDEYSKLKEDEKTLTSEYNKKLKEIKDKQCEILVKTTNQTNKSLPKIKVVSWDDVEDEKQKIFGDVLLISSFR